MALAMNIIQEKSSTAGFSFAETDRQNDSQTEILNVLLQASLAMRHTGLGREMVSQTKAERQSQRHTG